MKDLAKLTVQGHSLCVRPSTIADIATEGTTVVSDVAASYSEQVVISCS